MDSRTKRTALAIGLVALMALTLILLAVLQYRWIGEVGQAERTRLRAALDNSAQQFRTEFNAELRRMCLAFELEPDALAAHNWDRLIERNDNWLSEDRNVTLLEDVFLLTRSANGESEPQWLDAQAGQWLPSAWPARLDRIRKQLEGPFPARLPEPGSGRFSFWRALAEDFMLVQPLIAPDSASGTPELEGYLVLMLNQQYFQNVFVPEMLRRNFSGHSEKDFEAAVVMGAPHRRVLCASDSNPAARLFEMPDVRVRLLWDRTDLIPAGAGSPPRFPPHPLVGQNPGIPLFFGNEANEWELIAVFRGGSLEEIVSRSRRRTLAVSFGVLLLLGLGVTVIIIGARRAQLLADLQMKFVTGVSHDLRTPLAVICSAADNLAEGVIDDSKHRVKEYGTLIRSEGRKLSSMVEQILQYASLKSGPRKTDLRPVVLRNLVDDVLTDEKRLIDSIGFRVEVDIPEDLPAAWADPGILQQALRNLVCNSLKHGASGCWMRVRAMRVATAGKKEVSVSVEDRGPGIDPEDLPHVFEPFYRGRNASASDIPGSGLGLSVVEQSIIAMGGRVEARSHAGGGSTFTLYLPAAD